MWRLRRDSWVVWLPSILLLLVVGTTHGDQATSGNRTNQAGIREQRSVDRQEPVGVKGSDNFRRLVLAGVTLLMLVIFVGSCVQGYRGYQTWGKYSGLMLVTAPVQGAIFWWVLNSMSADQGVGWLNRYAMPPLDHPLGAVLLTGGIAGAAALVGYVRYRKQVELLRDQARYWAGDWTATINREDLACSEFILFENWSFGRNHVRARCDDQDFEMLDLTTVHHFRRPIHGPQGGSTRTTYRTQTVAVIPLDCRPPLPCFRILRRTLLSQIAAELTWPCQFRILPQAKSGNSAFQDSISQDSISQDSIELAGTLKQFHRTFLIGGHPEDASRLAATLRPEVLRELLHGRNSVECNGTHLLFHQPHRVIPASRRATWLGEMIPMTRLLKRQGDSATGLIFQPDPPGAAVKRLLFILAGGLLGGLGGFLSFAVILLTTNLEPLLLVPLFFGLMLLGLATGLSLSAWHRLRAE